MKSIWIDFHKNSENKLIHLNTQCPKPRLVLATEATRNKNNKTTE